MDYRILLFVLSIIVSTSFADAQDQEAVLEKGDVKKLVNTLKPMSEELEAVDVGLAQEKNPNMAAAFQANAEAMEILEKYGWDESFPAKWKAISAGYIKLKMKKEMKDMPEEQRKQAMQMMKKSNQQLYTSVADKDLELVRSNFQALDKMMENF